MKKYIYDEIAIKAVMNMSTQLPKQELTRRKKSRI